MEMSWGRIENYPISIRSTASLLNHNQKYTRFITSGTSKSINAPVMRVFLMRVLRSSRDCLYSERTFIAIQFSKGYQLTGTGSI